MILRINQKKGEIIRVFLEKLGPIFIKFGQILSTRIDLFDKDLIKSLSQLQNNISPTDKNVSKKHKGKIFVKQCKI